MATILVVDDRPLNRELLITVLGSQGHRVLEAGDGLDALAIVRNERPALVICDILMPTMDGYEFVRRVRAEPEIAATPVVFFTAHYHVREAKGLAASAGVERVLTKPCEPQEIIAVTNEVLGTARSDPPPPLADEDYQSKHLRLVTDKLSETVDELRLSNERLRALVDLNLRLVAVREPAHLLDETCRGARDLVGASHAVLGIRDRGYAESKRFFTSGFSSDAASIFAGAPLDEGEFATLMANRQPLRVVFSKRGRRVEGLPSGYPPIRSLLAAPLASPTAVYGWICLTDKIGADAFSADDEMLLTLLAALGGRGYENGSTFYRLRRQATAQVQALSRRLVEVQESERRHLARELHDRVGQNLTALSINLDILRARGLGNGDQELERRLTESIALIEATSEVIDNVMADLRPPVLEAEGLLPALRWHAENFAQRTGIQVNVSGEVPAQRPKPEIEITLFRIALEALNNVAKHAKASRVEVILDQSSNECVLSVTDNGVGFDPQAVRLGRGLGAMRERSEAIGGRFEVTSLVGEGTRVAASVARLE